jgi:hypothetical protein
VLPYTSFRLGYYVRGAKVQLVFVLRMLIWAGRHCRVEVLGSPNVRLIVRRIRVRKNIVDPCSEAIALVGPVFPSFLKPFIH